VARSAAFQNDETNQVMNIGASFNMGAFTVMAQAGQFALGNSKYRNALLGGTAKFGPGTFRASVGVVRDNSAAVDNATQLAAGYIYDLSRRTAVYGTVSRIDNDAAAALSTGSLAAAAGKAHTGFEVGVRHSF
jgi:predicted porin